MPFAGTLTTRLLAKRSVTGSLPAPNGALTQGLALSRAVDGILSFSGTLSARAAAVRVSGVLGALVGTLTGKLNGVPVIGASLLNAIIGKIKGLFLGKDIEL